MKKIIFFMPNIQRGGIEKNLILLSNYFINKKYPVEIYFTEISKEVKSQINFKAKLIKSKKFVKIGSNNRIINSINCGISALLNLKKRKKNIIISMQDHPISIIIGKIKGIKCAIRISNHPEASLKFFNSFLKFKLKLFIKIFFYKFSDTIICNSLESKKFLNKYINKKKIYFINNPVVLKKNKIQKKNKIIVAIGRIENQKNFLGIIKAFIIADKIIKNYKLLIIGSGSKKNQLISFVKKKYLFKKIKFLKFSKPDKYLSSSSLFILNSFFEGSPNILLEALNYKLPIIATDCKSGPSEILANGKFGYLVPVNNHKRLAKKIIAVLKNYEKAKKKSELGFNSLQRFNVEQQCSKYNFLINKTINYS